MKPFLLRAFLNAWWIAVNIRHKKVMQCVNNPDPEAVVELVTLTSRLMRLQVWASKRWGADHVGKLIHEKENA